MKIDVAAPIILSMPKSFHQKGQQISALRLSRCAQHPVFRRGSH